jgi:hypothetical protein
MHETGPCCRLSAAADRQGREVERVRPDIFTWRQFEQAAIAASVNRRLPYSLSPRHAGELPIGRGVSAGSRGTCNRETQESDTPGPYQARGIPSSEMPHHISLSPVEKRLRAGICGTS